MNYRHKGTTDPSKPYESVSTYIHISSHPAIGKAGESPPSIIYNSCM